MGVEGQRLHWFVHLAPSIDTFRSDQRLARYRHGGTSSVSCSSLSRQGQCARNFDFVWAVGGLEPHKSCQAPSSLSHLAFPWSKLVRGFEGLRHRRGIEASVWQAQTRCNLSTKCQCCNRTCCCPLSAQGLGSTSKRRREYSDYLGSELWPHQDQRFWPDTWACFFTRVTHAW